MSDKIKHECGIALIRLRRPLSYYREKYGTCAWGLDRLYLMMEKQHNRGQEGAGVACVKLDTEPGREYIFRERAMGNKAIGDVFSVIHKDMKERQAQGAEDCDLPFVGEINIGHLRYSTSGRYGISHTHPFLRRNNWQCRNLCLAGNFNLTNVDEIFASIIEQGQHPRNNADTFIMLEQLGSMLDAQAQELTDKFRGHASGDELNRLVEEGLDLEAILRNASSAWDGGYVLVGATGSGDSFAFRDPCGIRPAFWYADDEVVVVASERAVIQTVMNVETEQVDEIGPGQGLMIDRAGNYRVAQIVEPRNVRPCSFERIYFSRGSDRDIYCERKTLGRTLAEPILKAIDHDLDHTVFSFIPNTAEVAYYGMIEGVTDYLNEQKARKIAALADPSAEDVKLILDHNLRTEKLAVKDIKLRTFISEGQTRNDLAAHVYDVTYGSITPDEDTIVVIDDSIVRGTTLRQSVVKILGRLRPKEIIIVSSSPQVRYPDCYGIDMSSMSEFIAFTAAVDMLRESGRESLIEEVYRKCKAQEGLPKEQIVNYVKEIYEPFTAGQISERIARMVTPDGSCPVKMIFQSIEGLHEACPENNGDWYFTGDYPTPGGMRFVNRAFIEYFEGRE